LTKAREKTKGVASLAAITPYFGLKRDAFYKYRHREGKRLEIEQKVVAIVRQRRRSLPKEGVRKLEKSLKDEFENANLKVGRDTLFNILRKHNMLLEKNTAPEQQTLYTDLESTGTS